MSALLNRLDPVELNAEAGGQEQIPIPSTEDILKCQFHCWYAIPELKRRSIKSIVVDLSSEFLEYLQTDGVILPACAQDTPSAQPPHTVFNTAVGGNNEEISDYDCIYSDEPIVVEIVEDESQQLRRDQRADFPQLEAVLRNSIRQLGGSVFCKTNWSAPLDSTWINAGSLKCQRTAELYLLLKSSDRTAFDFEHMLSPQSSQVPLGLVVSGTESNSNNSGRNYTGAGYADDAKGSPERPTLVLRKWCNLTPSMEFRLFVRDGKLAGISQRDVTTFYEFLAGDAMNNSADKDGDDDDEDDEDEEDEEDEEEGGGKRNREEKSEKTRLKGLLLQWFYSDSSAGVRAESESSLSAPQDWLTEALGMASYSADVYVDRQDRVFLVDINVFGYPSDSLLFDWEELLPCADAASVPFVTLQSRRDERPSPIVQGQQQGPIDVHSAPDFSRFMQIVREQRGKPDSSSSSDEGGVA